MQTTTRLICLVFLFLVAKGCRGNEQAAYSAEKIDAGASPLANAGNVRAERAEARENASKGRAAGSNSDATDAERSLRKRAPKGLSDSFYRCISAADGAKIAAASCMSTEKKAQDLRLNSTYKALLAVLDSASKSALIEAQREWLRAKEKDEAFESLLYGSQQIDNLQQLENELFKLCERANTLDKYRTINDLK